MMAVSCADLQRAVPPLFSSWWQARRWPERKESVAESRRRHRVQKGASFSSDVGCRARFRDGGLCAWAEEEKEVAVGLVQQWAWPFFFFSLFFVSAGWACALGPETCELGLPPEASPCGVWASFSFSFL